MEQAARLSIRVVVVTTTLSSLALLITALLTTPDALGPFGITLWFMGLVIALAGILTLLFYYLGRLRYHRRERSQIFRGALRYGSLSAIWLTALISLNSLRQLGVKDIVLVSLLVSLIEFYLRRSA